MKDIVEAGLAQHIIAEVAALAEFSVAYNRTNMDDAICWQKVVGLLYDFGVVTKIAR